MGWKNSLVNVHLGTFIARHGPFKLPAQVSVESSDFPQGNSAASQENEHYAAQSGKIIPTSRHLRAHTAKLIHARMLFDLFRVTTAVNNGAAASIVFVGKVCGL